MSRQDQIHNLLGRLRAGEPAGELDTFGLLRPQVLDARRQLNDAVVSSANRGPRADRLAIWILGPYGGAKSNTLLLMREGLQGLAAGRFQSAVTRVDFKQDREATNPRGLQLALFYHMAIVGTGRLGDEWAAWTSPLLKKARRRGDLGANAVALGLDIVFTLANIPAPGASGAVGTAWKSLVRKWTLRDANLRRIIQGLGFSDPEAEEFVLNWVAYSLRPGEDTWERFRRHTEALARTGRLFAVTCRMLEKVGYASVTVFLDECDLLIGNQTLTGALESLRAAGAEGRHDLNIFFVLAGVDRLAELDDEVVYRGFPRRFIRAEDGPVIQATLSQPLLDHSAEDDLSRVAQTLAGMSPDAPPYLRDSLRRAPEAIGAIRKRLAEVENMTWTKFWTAVLSEIEKEDT